MLNELVTRKGGNSIEDLACAKAESIVHRELISKRVQSWASRVKLRAWLHGDRGMFTNSF